MQILPAAMVGWREEPAMAIKSSWASRFLYRLRRLCLVRPITIRLSLIITVAASVLSLFYLQNIASSSSSRETRLRLDAPDPSVPCRPEPSVPNDHSILGQQRVDGRALVLVETPYTSQGQEMVRQLEASRLRFRLELVGKALPSLTHLKGGRGRYAVIVFERLESYLNMDKWNRELLDKYCREYQAGMVAFARPREPLVQAQVRGFPLFVHSRLALSHLSLAEGSGILRLARAGGVLQGRLPGDDWTVFVANHSTYEPLAFAKLHPSAPSEQVPQFSGNLRYVTAVLDRGHYDGVRRVLFGGGFQLWLHRLLFLDALSFLSHGKLSTPLERYLLVDIDDIFVGKNGTRMTPADVQVLDHPNQNGQ